MAVGPRAPKASGRPDPAAAKAAAPRSGWQRFLSLRLLAGFLIALIAIDGGVWVWSRTRGPVAAATDRDQILTLGTFEFNRTNPRDQHLYHGQFDVAIRLANDLEIERFHDVERQQRELQRTVSATLRRLRAGDFTDPHLLHLKYRLLERLNDTLGFEAIDDLLIDNFSIEQTDRTSANSALPAAEKSADGSD